MRRVDAQSEIRLIAARHDELLVLVLFGSRARGEAHEHSDWDFGYLAGDRFRPEVLFRELNELLHTDRIDLVDLRRSGGLLRFRAARDGVPLFERRTGDFDRFALDAVSFWCDAAPVIDRAYRALLEDMGP